MATFLELCEKTAEESGGTGRAPVTVVDQAGRQRKIVNWVRDAWVKIQNSQTSWFFLRGEFEKTLTAGVAAYSSTSWAIPRFAEWLAGISLHDPAIGRADEGRLSQITFDRWRQRWDFGEQDQNRPTEYAFAPDGALRFGAVPDDAYVVRGEYRKAPQVLAANGDIPDMPARFHDAIVWRAVMLMSEHDEAPSALFSAKAEFDEIIAQMQRDQLPQINVRAGRPLA